MPFVLPHNAGDVADGRQSANSSPLELVTAVTGTEFIHLRWLHLANLCVERPSCGQHKWKRWTLRQGECQHRFRTGSDPQADSLRFEDSLERCRGWDDAYLSIRHLRFQTSRVVNVASGSVASGFLYATNSITEIDMEQLGNKASAVDCTNWKRLSNFQDTEVAGYNQAGTHNFKIVWRCYVTRGRQACGVPHPSGTKRPGALPLQFLGHQLLKAGRHSHHRNHPLHLHQQLQYLP